MTFYVTVSSGKKEMPSQNAPILELKVTNLPLDLPCSVLVTDSRETLTTGKSYKKKPDRLFPKDETEINNFCMSVSQFNIIYKEKSNKMQQYVKMFIIPYLYKVQHVSGDTPPIIRSRKLH
jgi:hypothetical protein